MSFSSSIDRFGRKVKDNHIKVKRMSAFDLFASIIIGTPVDTGQLRNNWYVQMGAPSNAFNSSTKETVGQQDMIAKTQRDLWKTTIKDDIFLTNNLPYGPRIEFDAWSWRKRKGMVRVNTIRWKTIVKNNTALVRAGY